MTDLFSLQGRVALVTGGSRGIGRMIAAGFLAQGAKVYISEVIHSLNDPVYEEGATAVLKGNLAPNGCVIKPAASWLP